jgi:Zn-dependent protease with chaperone function
MTRPLAIGVLLAFSAVTAATLIGWSIVAVLWPHLPRLSKASPAARAMALAYLRTLPLALVAIVVPTQIVAFARHESGCAESVGLLLFVTGAIGAALTLDAIGRALRSWYGTVRAVRRWKRAAMAMRLPVWRDRAWTIDVPLPVAVVVGIFRPQLFIAEQVVDSCTRDELMAIVAHETAHVHAYDNVVRWLFHCTPGSGLFARRVDDLEGVWEGASEEAADAAASRATSPFALASALLKVAHLACAQPSGSLAASALIGRNSLRTRVVRLMQSVPDATRPTRPWVPLAVLLSVAFVLQLGPASWVVHEAFELLVRHR